MQCNHLIRLMKDWYLHVQQETMAPARMMQFAERHIASCEECQQDTELADEIEKIREMLLPESKIPKSKRDVQSATPEISPEEDEGLNNGKDVEEQEVN